VQIQELVDAKVDRIAELESELERLRPSEDAIMSDPRSDLEALSVEELRQKYVKLERDFDAINKELPLLERSYKKSMSLAHNKVMDFRALEERVATLTAEKSKADQKYFAARKDMDIRTSEMRALRVQNGKSSEIVSQLKDVETQNRALIGSLEKQIAALKQDMSTSMTEKKRLEQLSAEATRRADTCKAQISSLTDFVKTKDGAVASMKEKLLNVETELEKAKVDVKEIGKDCNKWKVKCQSNSSEEEEALRVSSFVFGVCSYRFSWANRVTEFGDLLGLQEQLQKHDSQRVRPRLLQQLRRRPASQPDEEVPQLQQSFRPLRCHGCAPLGQACQYNTCKPRRGSNQAPSDTAGAGARPEVDGGDTGLPFRAGTELLPPEGV
jgi:hypothetical protein